MKTGEMPTQNTLMEDFQEILMMAAGADGGIASVYISQFLRQCDAEGTDVLFVRQFAKLCRVLAKGYPKI